MDTPTYTYQESKVLAHCIKLVEKSLKVLKRKMIQWDPHTHTRQQKTENKGSTRCRCKIGYSLMPVGNNGKKKQMTPSKTLQCISCQK